MISVKKSNYLIDVDLGGILELIKSNVKTNTEVIKAPVTVMPLDFYQPEWCEELSAMIGQVDIVLAADGKLTIVTTFS